jgi:hypothetical protein
LVRTFLPCVPDPGTSAATSGRSRRRSSGAGPSASAPIISPLSASFDLQAERGSVVAFAACPDRRAGPSTRTDIADLTMEADVEIRALIKR